MTLQHSRGDVLGDSRGQRVLSGETFGGWGVKEGSLGGFGGKFGVWGKSGGFGEGILRFRGEIWGLGRKLWGSGRNLDVCVEIPGETLTFGRKF